MGNLNQQNDFEKDDSEEEEVSRRGFIVGFISG